jgi:2,3-diaminopropionate biosynthesis protein SbnA
MIGASDPSIVTLDGFAGPLRVILKLEWLNPVGSIKAATARALVDSLPLDRPGPPPHLIESTSGNLGLALAAICAERGYGFTCVVDPNSNGRAIRLVRPHGAEDVVVHRRDENGGYLGARIDYIRRRIAGDPHLIWPNQYANAANVWAHAAWTAPGIHAAVGAIDGLFVGAGTTGTLMGCAQYFRAHSPSTRVFGVDSVGSVTFGTPAGPRHIPGLGASRLPPIYDGREIDHRVLVDEREAVVMCREVAQTWGIAVGGSSGAVLAAVRRRQTDFRAGDTVVAISPDGADRYIDTVYDDEWVEARWPGVTGERLAPVAPLPQPVAVGGHARAHAGG